MFIQEGATVFLKDNGQPGSNLRHCMNISPPIIDLTPGILAPQLSTLRQFWLKDYRSHIVKNNI